MPTLLALLIQSRSVALAPGPTKAATQRLPTLVRFLSYKCLFQVRTSQYRLALLPVLAILTSELSIHRSASAPISSPLVRISWLDQHLPVPAATCYVPATPPNTVEDRIA